MKPLHSEPDLRPGRSLVILVLLLFVLSTSAIAAGAFDGPEPFIVPAAAFNLDGSAGTDYFFFFAGGYLSQQGAGTSCFVAPLYLPEGTRIFYMRLSAYDSSAQDLAVQMSRTSLLSGGGSDVMALASTSGSSGLQLPEDRTISFDTIDNRNYHYRLETCLIGNTGSALRIYAVTIGAVLFPDGFESGNTSEWSVTVP